MKVTITPTLNSAFGDNDYEMRHELARILREIADKLEKDYEAGPCRDYNGNTVGQWSV